MCVILIKCKQIGINVIIVLLQKSFSFIDNDEHTYKQYYYSPLSPQPTEEESGDTCGPRKMKSQAIDKFFELAPKSKKRKLVSSTVARMVRDGVSYISTNTEDAEQATHLIKIEVYDMKKLSKIPTTEHWKHATTRIKYYVKNSNDAIYDNTNSLVYNITETIAESEKVKKYFFNNDSHQKKNVR